MPLRPYYFGTWGARVRACDKAECEAVALQNQPPASASDSSPSLALAATCIWLDLGGFLLRSPFGALLGDIGPYHCCIWGTPLRFQPSSPEFPYGLPLGSYVVPC